MHYWRIYPVTGGKKLTNYVDGKEHDVLIGCCPKDELEYSIQKLQTIYLNTKTPWALLVPLQYVSKEYLKSLYCQLVILRRDLFLKGFDMPVVFVSVFVSLMAVSVVGRRMQAINCLVRIKDSGLETSRPILELLAGE